MRIRAFIFEDDEMIRSLLKTILETRGYEVFTFPDAGSSTMHLADCCECPFRHVCGDIIISDVNMPNMTGVQFIKNQMEKGCKIKHLALISGAWSDSDLQVAQEMGCYIFHKPFTMDEVNKWLDACEKQVSPDRVLCNWLQKVS